MKFVVKILVAGVLAVVMKKTHAQNETYLQPFSSLLNINSSFAGYDKNAHFSVGNQYYYINKEQTYNLFYASFDKYADKLKGGLGIWFQQGLIGHNNISTSELGFAYSGFEKKSKLGTIKFSINTSALLATKQWFAYTLDNIFIKKSEPHSLPGKKFTRYYLLKPGLGFLYNYKTFQLGVAANVPFQFNLTYDGEEGYQRPEKIPVNLSLFLSHKTNGKRNGLSSSPYEATPQFILFYNKEFVLSRASLQISHVKYIYGAFVQNDFTNSIHTLGGTFGYRYKNLQFLLNTGAGIPGLSDDIGVSAELALQILIPTIQYSKINPWAPNGK